MKGRAATARLLEKLAASGEARLVRRDGGGWIACGPGAGRKAVVGDDIVRGLLADGLLAAAEPGRLKAAPEARSFLKRREAPEAGFAGQHGAVVLGRIHDGTGPIEVRINRAESPVALLAGRGGKVGWLAPPELEAAERLRRDFEKGQMQPRVTANWSAAVNAGRRSGDGGADLADAALAARRRVEAALASVGPEFSGPLVDICCFLKGLETVERERQWPARSAKLVLRLGLQALARHYGLSAVAEGAPRRRVRHWGTADFRPSIS